MEMVNVKISVEKLMDVISDITGYDLDEIHSYDRLVNDLGFDSFMLMDMYSSLVPPEDRAKNADLLKEIISNDITVEDLISKFDIAEKSKTVYSNEVSCIDNFPEVTEFIEYYNKVGEHAPYFRINDGLPGNIMSIEGESKINFSTYNYVGLNGDKRINDFVKETIDKYGTSVSGSRLLTGEIQLHRDLENAIANFLGTEAAIVQVGGHSTNVNTIGNIVDDQDLILHDALAHNSIIEGCILSHAKRKPFKHNDMEHLESELLKLRHKFRRVLIVVEGVYSMDGDICNLPELIELKKKYGCILMIDEAHSFGTIGDHGRGVTSYWNINPKDVDILMGTLSKSCCSCGGYIAGSKTFIKHLKYNSPGFIFSCGITPPNAASAYKAIEIFSHDESYVKRLNKNSEYFLNEVKKLGFNTGLSKDTPIVPIIIGNSEKAMVMSNKLYELGINAMPIVYPAVHENEARIRFFISASHTKEDLNKTIEALKKVL